MQEEMTQVHKSEIEDIALEISGTLQAAFDLLIQRREAALASTFAPLDAEKESLAREYADIGEAAHSLELLLPATAREAQREADALLLAGKADEAEAKMKAAQEAANAPGTMKARQQAISARLEAIDAERKVVAKRVFEQWYGELQHIVRGSEHGLFIELLDKARNEMYAFQERHQLVGSLAEPYGFLVKDHHLANLTAPERSAEWQSGQRWYKGRQ